MYRRPDIRWGRPAFVLIRQDCTPGYRDCLNNRASPWTSSRYTDITLGANTRPRTSRNFLGKIDNIYCRRTAQMTTNLTRDFIALIIDLLNQNELGTIVLQLLLQLLDQHHYSKHL